MINKINNFFFPLEEGEKLSLHDAVWFYGFLTAVVTWVAYLAIILW